MTGEEFFREVRIGDSFIPLRINGRMAAEKYTKFAGYGRYILDDLDVIQEVLGDKFVVINKDTYTSSLDTYPAVLGKHIENGNTYLFSCWEELGGKKKFKLIGNNYSINRTGKTNPKRKLLL